VLRPPFRGSGRRHTGSLAALCLWAACGSLTSDETFAAAYLDRLLTDAQAAGMDLVTWISDRDLLIARS
jgi:hypothetical protein